MRMSYRVRIFSSNIATKQKYTHQDIEEHNKKVQ